MRRRKSHTVFLMLIASLFVLLSVILPHHHRSDGMACYALVEHLHDADSSEPPTSSSDHATDCGCNGHNPAFYSTANNLLDLTDAHIFLMPLLVLIDYIYPPEPLFCGDANSVFSNFYNALLYDSWIVSATGLRAPPAY